ncbi:hypothetical protein AB1Y20_001558 [Prymnesium parvum]|uniref:NADPH-dependent diflavin oxidoreductase 1 n=1 Tax=Prymnesium parvum TaxID=97485 RepID=A0AB34K854_PRYPA
MLVLFGSQTGSAEEIARQVAEGAVRFHLPVRCVAMDEYDPRLLPTEQLVVCVASTTGEGEVPDNMRAFWRFLLRKDLPHGSLASLRHASFGLGDSSYPKFNYAAKRLHRRLEQLGSAALVPLGLGDDQDGLGVDHALRPWLSALWPAVLAVLPPPPSLLPIPESETLPPRYSVEPLAGAAGAPPAAAFDALRYTHCHGSDVSARRPFCARVLSNLRLTAEGAREVRHLSLSLRGSGLRYAAGDAVAVQPRNPRGATLDLLAALSLDAAAAVEIRAAAPHAPPLPAARWTVLELFSHHLDVFGVPRRPFFALLARFARHEAQRERLEEFGRVEGAAGLAEYCTRPRRTYAEVLRDFPSARPPLPYYLDLIPPLRARYFSIASSPRRHPEEVHLCVAVVRYQTMIKAPRFGVCSTFLASLRAPPSSDGESAPAASPEEGLDGAQEEAGDVVPIWLRKGCLSPPSDPTAPLLMVGPGTGVAPFRAFVQEREMALGEAALGEAVLFFGCRKRTEDYLYASEWQAHLARGSLNELHVAFSREQQHKVYVQHLMRAMGAKLWELLSSSNAHVYIAGASNQMPKAVRKAMHEVAVEHGQLDAAAADAFFKTLEARGRLQCETW